MYYNEDMDRTIRNLDRSAYRALKARAAAEGKSLGRMVSDAIVAYLSRPPAPGASSLADLTPEDLGPGTERSSLDVDRTVYGA